MALPNACLRLFLLLLTFLKLVAGCPPPYNDFDFLGNETHTTADLVRIAVDSSPYSPETAWVEVVTSSGRVRTPWPRGDIVYCFANPRIRQMYETIVLDAWKLWSDRLGTPGQANGFQLRFREFDYGQQQWRYCFLEQKPGYSSSLLWNPYVSADVLVIDEHRHPAPGMVAFATLGYIPADFKPSWTVRELQGRRAIKMVPGGNNGISNQWWKAAIAHEIGHVFGLEHEHQRGDRDQYIRFNCEALTGYAEAKRKVSADPQWSIADLCVDGGKASYYNFDAVLQYDNRDHFDRYDDNGNPWYLRQLFPLVYDGESLMHYPSHTPNFNDPNLKLRTDLTFWKNRGPNFVPPATVTNDDLEYIPIRYWPSGQDIEGLKRIYPWMGGWP